MPDDSPPSTNDGVDLLELDRPALAALVAQLGHPSYRARQIWRNIYVRGATGPAGMTDLPRDLRDALANAIAPPPQPLEVQTSADASTTKALLSLADGEMVETVLIRHEPHDHADSAPRRTICLSTQAGCAMACVFCATGKQGFRRQLGVAEVMRQALLARDWARAEGSEITNIVFMGMGEPLANYPTASAAIDRLVDPDGFALSPRRITVSTIGLIPQIRRLAAEHPQVNLAISLHAPDDRLRKRLVPVPAASVRDLIQAARDHADATGRRVTFEYVLLAGENDAPAQARRLAARLRGLRCQVNLIPLNPSAGVLGRRPSRRATLGFQRILAENGIRATVRVEKGLDIAAACGQLRGDRLRSAQPNPQTTVRAAE